MPRIGSLFVITTEHVLVAVLALLLTASVVSGQSPSMPSTLRYGSGLIDIPVSSVLPHMAVTGTFSGFFMDVSKRVIVDESGNQIGMAPGIDKFLSDGSLAFGLFDRFEAGASMQSFGGESDSGNVWGLFGRMRLLEPIDQGIGLAAGARYLTSPDFGDGYDYSPGRLGFADDRLKKSYTGDTSLSLYGVATAYLRGFDGGPLPENDVTFSLGYGTGMFREGGTLGFYAPGHANGWFYGTALHIGTSDDSVLTLMAEHNGFDVNVGAQYDWGGVRVGVHYLASNHAMPVGGYFSEYQKPKLGILGSISACPNISGFRCRPQSMERTEPDTIFIPPPPPDTVIVVSTETAIPEGEDIEVCLSTGQNISVRVTAVADTLVGAEFVSLRSIRPAVDFVGSYAGNAFWYVNGDPIEFEGDTFGQGSDTFPIDCGQILRVGVYQGVPVFADRAVERPLVMLFIPVRPGVWRLYERGIP